MTQTNISILHDYFIEVINQKHLDLISKYVSEKFIGHGSPYVGMGVMTDDSSGDKIIIQAVYPGSPAEGKLKVGDEILSACEGDRTWQTYEELRMGGLWGQGAIGTTLSVCVLRQNAEIEINITRGLVKGFEYYYKMVEEGTRSFFKEYPDVKTNLVNVIESGDLVAYQAEYQGQNVHYGRSSAWTEFGFVRIQNSKITDWWSSDEAVSQIKQLGYTILAPVMVKA